MHKASYICSININWSKVEMHKASYICSLNMKNHTIVWFFIFDEQLHDSLCVQSIEQFIFNEHMYDSLCVKGLLHLGAKSGWNLNLPISLILGRIREGNSAALGRLIRGNIAECPTFYRGTSASGHLRISDGKYHGREIGWYFQPISRPWNMYMTSLFLSSWLA